MQYIWTCQADMIRVAQVELKRKDRSFNIIKELDEGIYLSETNMSIQDLVDVIKLTPIVFVRHVFEVDLVLERLTDFDLVINTIYGVAIANLDQDLTYGIQIRTQNNIDVKKEKIELRTILNQKFEQDGYKLDVKHCQQIISIFIDQDNYYIGISPAPYHLSIWAGGMRHFSKDNQTISRASFKLIEMIELFDLKIKKGDSAIDLGAAPGGWSKVLLDMGLHVTAVDPALMDKRIKEHSNFRHYQETTQKFLERGSRKKYQVIVNDMKMNVNDSLDLTTQFIPYLDLDGLVIMTLKLPQSFDYRYIKGLLAKLNRHYKLMYARQLFHNRSEFTVVLHRKTKI